MTDSAPSSVRPMWSNAGGLCSFRGSLFLGGTLGRDPRPLPLATNRVWLSGLSATAVGYQPTGMKPLATETFGSETSTTITSLLSALATNSVLPSGETATPQGVLPSGDCG